MFSQLILQSPSPTKNHGSFCSTLSFGVNFNVTLTSFVKNSVEILIVIALYLLISSVETEEFPTQVSPFGQPDAKKGLGV